MSDHTWLRNPDTGGIWACPNRLVDHYKDRGWEDSDPPEEEQPVIGEFTSAADAPEPPTKDPIDFDVAEHTVAEVEEHLEKHPDDVERVVEAELASEKPRTSITGKSE
jgi:hypothetical protein